MVKINKKYKKAFSLAEAIMSMLIIMIAIICIAPILTKQRPGAGLNTVTIKGSFGCYEGGSASFLCKE